MGKRILVFAFLLSIACIGQTKDLKTLRQTDNLEEYIYSILDEFLKNPTEENLRSLPKAFWRAPKNSTEKLAWVVFLCNRGYYQTQFGHTVSAVESYEKSWQVFDSNKLADYDIVEFCLKPLGNLYMVLGDYDNAENTIKQYYFIAEKQKNQPAKIAAVLNLSSVYQSSGKFQAAAELLQNTLQNEPLTSMQKGKLLNNLGVSYMSLENWQKAKTALEKGLALLRKDKNESEAVSNSFRNLAFVYSKFGENDKAIYYYEQARLAFMLNPNPEPRKRAKLYYDQAVLYFRQGKIQESKQSLNAVFQTLLPGYDAKKNPVPAKSSLYAETALLDACDFQALLLSSEKQYQKALEFYDRSFHIEELLASLFVYENTKLLAQDRKRERTEKCISLYEKLYRKDQNKQWIENAFLLSETTKSGILKEHISRSLFISPNEKRILKQLQDWNTVILKEQQKSANAQIQKISEAIEKQNELVLLLKSMRAENNKAPSEFSIQDLHQKLARDKARMISYFAGSEKLYCFSIDGKSVRMQVSDNRIYTSIRDFISFFDRASAIAEHLSGYQKLAFELYASLNLAAESKNQTLLLVPDGLLHFLPFEALLTKAATTSDFSKMPYLVKDCKIGYTHSAELYVTDYPFKFEQETVLGVFPVFANSALELSFSKQELAAIRQKFSGKYLENQQAGFENFKRNAPAFSILHLSTHASAGDWETPATLRFYDREMLYSELYNLEINPDLVVLSACETGIGKLYKGEGTMSVARGFQFAGAKNLLFSLWKVNDFTTSLQMSEFYKNIKKGHSYLESNHLSKIEYLNSTQIPNLKKSPYYWSAMVYYGTLQTKPQHNYLWIIWVLFSAIALFLAYRKLRKQHGETARFPE